VDGRDKAVWLGPAVGPYDLALGGKTVGLLVKLEPHKATELKLPFTRASESLVGLQALRNDWMVSDAHPACNANGALVRLG